MMIEQFLNLTHMLSILKWEDSRTASKVYNLKNYEWNDEVWWKKENTLYNKAMNIYEVHLELETKRKWKFYTYKELAEELVSYVKKMNYTHIELLPIAEHPYDKSFLGISNYRILRTYLKIRITWRFYVFYR